MPNQAPTHRTISPLTKREVEVVIVKELSPALYWVATPDEKAAWHVHPQYLTPIEAELSELTERVELEGEGLARFLAELGAQKPSSIYRLRISTQGQTVKWKINEGMWTPPYRNELGR